MRNKYPGICYRCQTPVPKGEGHFERHKGGWRVQHAACAIKHRKPRAARSEPTGRFALFYKQMSASHCMFCAAELHISLCAARNHEQSRSRATPHVASPLDPTGLSSYGVFTIIAPAMWLCLTTSVTSTVGAPRLFYEATSLSMGHVLALGRLGLTSRRIEFRTIRFAFCRCVILLIISLLLLTRLLIVMVMPCSPALT